MGAARWIGFSFMYMAIFSFLLMITQQGNMPAITVSGLVNQFVITTVVAAGVAITAALAVAIAAEKASAEFFGFGAVGGGSVAIASVKVAVYVAAIAFVVLWSVWLGGLLVNMMPAGMPGWMGILFIGPFLLPTVFAIASEFLAHKS